LDEDTIQSIINIMAKSNIKPNKAVKKQVNVMKTNKIQAKKDLNENKIIMIMNKISDSNINQLTVEYITNVLVDTEEKYNTIQDEIFNKIIKDIKFIDNYIKFALNIFMIEKHRLNLAPERFIENIINCNCNNSNNNTNENIRIGAYEMIKKLTNINFFNNNIIDYVSNIVLSNLSPDRLIDTYHWFNNINLNIDTYIEGINNMIVLCGKNNMNRERILIESIIEKVPVKIICNDINNDNDINTIIEEYLNDESIENISKFVEAECKEIDDKNNFAKIVFLNYIDTFNSKLFDMLETLINEKVLFKSNLSKGLVLLTQDSDIDRDIIVNILKFLKNQNITKNIENIFRKYKVKIYYDE
jgi:hypothetical protein